MNTQRTTLILALSLPTRTGRVASVPASLLCLVTLLAAGFTARPAQAAPFLLVGSIANNSGTVSKYDAVTGAAINVPFFPWSFAQSMVVDQNNHLFVTGVSGASEFNATTGANINPNFATGFNDDAWRLALDGNNHLFVSGVANIDGNIVGKYDAKTGATINAGFIQEPNPQSLSNPRGLAVDNKNHLFVSNTNANTVAEYDATTGAMINPTFIHQGLHDPGVLLLDGLGHLLVGDNFDSATVGMYDATTGATLSAAFIPGLPGGTVALALDGSNHLFVANNDVGVGEYDATTGAIINEHFIGLHGITGLAFVAAVPEPSTFVLAALATVGLAAIARRRQRRHNCLPIRTGVVTIILAALLWAATASQSLAITYKTLNDPLATQGTSAIGISGNNIVGSYNDSLRHAHSFLYDGTNWTSLDDPTATNGTFVSGITTNNIVGSYSDGTNLTYNHGFRYDGNTWTTLDDPSGVFGTYASGISGNNIVGFYDTSNSDHGFIYNGVSYTTLNDPLATTRGNLTSFAGTLPQGIDGNNIVGTYADDAFIYHGFIYDGIKYTTLDDPLGTEGTFANGIFANTIVGSYQDNAGISHGFLYDGSTYTTLDDPLGTMGTTINAISGDTVVGFYTDASRVNHGFLATVPEPATFVLAGSAFVGMIAWRWRGGSWPGAGTRVPRSTSTPSGRRTSLQA